MIDVEVVPLELRVVFVPPSFVVSVGSTTWETKPVMTPAAPTLAEFV